MRLLPCPDDERLEGYLYRTLSILEESVVRLHLCSCGRCRARLESMREFDCAIRAIPTEEPPLGFEDDLIRMVKSWDFDPDPPAAQAGSLSDEREAMPVSWGYRVRWAVGSLVFLLGTFLQYRYGSLLHGAFGERANLFFSLQDLGSLLNHIVSGAWISSVKAIIAAVRTDGFASLEILRTALPSQALGVLVFGGITMVVFVSQHRASKGRGEGTE